jgi:hypothetical protein
MLHTQITTTHVQLNLITPQSSASRAIRLLQFPALKPALSQDNNPHPHEELMIWSNIAASALSARHLQVQNTHPAQARPLHSLSRPIFVPPFINFQTLRQADPLLDEQGKPTFNVQTLKMQFSALLPFSS